MPEVQLSIVLSVKPRNRVLTWTQFFDSISIVPRLRVLYLFIALYVTLGRPQSLSTAIPPSLANAVPVCARLCLQSFIAESFPTITCSSQQDLDCLCTHKSSSGYTLGEGALRCVASACTNETARDAGAYEVCAGIQNALSNTHATITATMVAATTTSLDSNIFNTNDQTMSSQVPSSSLFQSSINAPSGSVSLSGLLTATGTPSIPASSTTIPSLTPSTSMPSQTSQAAASTSSAAPVKTGALTTPQIAGIAVAGVASASVAFGIMLFVYCLRRRRALKHQSEQLPFEIEKAPEKANHQRPTPPPPPPKDVKGGDGNIGNVAPSVDRGPKVPPKDSAKRRSFWRRTIKPDDIGVAVSPETAHQASPESVASYRTTSRLLPDKPAYTLWPPSSRMTQHSRPGSTATNFEEDLDGGRRSVLGVPMQAPRGRNSIDTSQWPVQRRYTQKQHYPQESFLDPRALMYAKERDKNLRCPSLPTNIRPENPPEGQWTISPDTIRRPPALRHPTSLTPAPSHMRNLAQLTSAPPTARSSNYSGNPSLASSEPGASLPTQSYHPAFRRSMNKRESMRYSNASDTSFESAGDEDESPPAEPALSPVAESPHGSPISALTYPKVPHSASIAKKAGIYRPLRESRQPDTDHARNRLVDHGQSKAMTKRDESPSSLLAKRRGDKAAAELEKGLRLRQDGNAAPKSDTKWKVVNSPGIENTGQGLKSPVWEPKLTPTMRGGDLYLDVQ